MIALFAKCQKQDSINRESMEISKHLQRYRDAAMVLFESLGLPMDPDLKKLYQEKLETAFPLQKAAKNISHKINDFLVRINGAKELNPNLDVSDTEELLRISQQLFRLYENRISTYEAPFIMTGILCFLDALDQVDSYKSSNGFQTERKILILLIEYFKLEDYVFPVDCELECVA